MDIQSQEIQTKAIKYTMKENGEVIGRVSLFFITNDLHGEPYGLVEDVFVN
ncbi:MAG: GNAT family N-acetyltransferase, partial [Candidatus Magasanikbacteria bacterium CG10_big_fil_rev_8_21_14_0_10_43_9]